MVDVSHKVKTLRYARAQAVVRFEGDIRSHKGDVLEVARVAGVMASKRTSEIIPLCHNIPLLYCDVSFQSVRGGLLITSEVKAIHHTGVEMEALVAVVVSALTVYDMLKGRVRDLKIEEVKLLSKKGGTSDFREEPVGIRAAVVVVSDSVFAGKKEDTSGKLILERLKEEGVEVSRYEVVPDEPDVVDSLLRRLIGEGYDLIITTGGTGFSKRDSTPEVTRKLLEREAPGLAEYMRFYGYERTPYAMLSRAVAGIAGSSLLINLPGSKSGVRDALNSLLPYVFHALKVMKLKGGGHDKGRRGHYTDKQEG